jgi:hypothetical protein
MPEKGRGEKEVAATAHNKLPSLLYPMITNRPESNKDIMEIYAKQIGTYFVTLEFSNMRGTGTDFKDVFTSKQMLLFLEASDRCFLL